MFVLDENFFFVGWLGFGDDFDYGVFVVVIFV